MAKVKTAEYICTRAMRLNGRDYTPGVAVDVSEVTPTRLALLVKTKFLEIGEEQVKKEEPAPEKKTKKEVTVDDLATMTHKKLIKLAESRGIDSSGSKPALRRRLRAALA